MPLFRKYRPQSFKDVVGQENLVKALTNAIELGRIANAYLFTGPRGTGKTSCARIFAKSLNCTEGPTAEPCQKCPSCLDITNASGLDVIEIDAATNRGIDDAKELIAQTQYAPMNGKYKIFIIDEVHMLSNEAFNALLKTFEEPPSNVIFILATTEPHKVIETIVSRCQRFDLRRITTDDITKRLRQISDLEGIKITDDALFTIAKNVSGGLRDSLALLDQVSILGARSEITKEDIENLLGKITFDVAFDFLNTILSRDVEKALVKIGGIYDRGLEPKNFCENYIEFMRNLAFAINSTSEENILKFTNFNKGDIEKIKAENLDYERIFEILDRVVEFYKEIRYTSNPYLWAELMVIDICSATSQKNIQNSEKNMPQITPQQVMSQIRTIETKAAQALEPNSGHKVAFLREESKQTGSTEEFAESPKNNYPISENQKTEISAETKTEPLQTEIEQAQTQEQSFKEEINTPKEAAAEEFDIKETLKQETPPKIPEVVGVDTPAPQASSGNSDPVEIWTKILNTIESPPAKFFYSDVARLVNIENKRITLGFVNENAIGQAKSDLKLKRLNAAMEAVLGAGCSVDFILLTADTKVIDVNITPKPQTKRVSMNSVPKEFMDMSYPPEAHSEAPQSSAPKKTFNKPSNQNNQTNESSENETTLEYYGKKTRDMIETFNGKIIE